MIRRRPTVLLLVSLTAIGCKERRAGTSSGNGSSAAPSAPPSAAPLQPTATSKERPRHCLAYEAIPEFGAEWEVKRSRGSFECHSRYDLWVSEPAGKKPLREREKPDVVVELCDWGMAGYDSLDRSDRKSRGKDVKVLLPSAFINAQTEQNKDLEFGGQLEVERRFDDGVSGVLIATFHGLTLTQFGSLLEALTQAPGQPWPNQERFRYGTRCMVFNAARPGRWELLTLLAP